jgi:two-component system, NtrC family, sensor kinase
LGKDREPQQVFINLVSNAKDGIISQALKSGRSSTIRITSSNVGEVTVLRVSDTGGGVPEEFIDKLFEPFTTTKSSGRGMGLGLSICHGIVRDYNGGIKLEKSDQDGSVFRLEFPIAPE